MQVCLPLPRLRQVPPHLLSISPCLQSWVAHVGCCELLLPACLPACLPAFLSSFLPSFLPAFQPSFLPSFLPAFQASFLPSFLPSTLPSFLPSFHQKTGKNPKKNNPPFLFLFFGIFFFPSLLFVISYPPSFLFSLLPPSFPQFFLSFVVALCLPLFHLRLILYF